MKVNHIWPGYVPPQKEEIFSSWLMRICEQHIIKSHTFSKFYLANTQLWNRDIDLYPPSHLIETLLNQTPLTKFQAEALFLTSYEGTLYNDRINIPLINSLGIVHRKRKNFGMNYCPGCLDKEIIYYKKKWRLSINLICTECNLSLQDRCKKCQHPICFHRLETGYKSEFLNHKMNICYNCKTDLRINSFEIPNDNLIRYQKYIDTTLSYGFNDKTSYSFQYFDVLTIIYNTILTNNKLWQRVKNGTEKELGIFVNDSYVRSKFEITTRQIFYPIAYELLNNWPTKFISFCRKYSIRYSDFSKDFKIPYWFSSVLLDSNLSQLNTQSRI